MLIFVFVLVATFLGYIIYTNWTKTVDQNSGETTITYNSRCFECKEPVSSQTSQQCNTCNHFKCRKCGKCMCSYTHTNSHRSPIDYTWEKIGESTKQKSISTQANQTAKKIFTKNCTDCGKGIESKYSKCYDCNRKHSSSKECSDCGTKIESYFTKCSNCNNKSKYKSNFKRRY